MFFVGDRRLQSTGVRQLKLRGNFPLPVLAFRRLDVGRHRRLVTDDGRQTGVLPLARSQRILVLAAREGLCQVRRSVTNTSFSPTHQAE